MSKRDELMAYITATATADSEEDVERLLSIFNPVEDRQEMGKVFDNVLGYNPITHYDMKDIMAVIDDVEIHAGETDFIVVDAVMEKRDEIAEEAMKIYEANRSKNIKEAVAKATEKFCDADTASAVYFYLTGEAPSVEDIADDDEDEDSSLGDDIGEDLDDDLELDIPKDLTEDEDIDMLFEEEDDE